MRCRQTDFCKLQQRPSVWLWLFVLFCLYGTSPAHANRDARDLIFTATPTQIDSLNDHLEYYQAGTQDPDISSILKVHDYHWKSTHALSPALSMEPRQVMWYRTWLDNQTPYQLQLVLSNTNPASDETQAYLSLTKYDVSNASPLSTLEHYPETRHDFRLTVAPGQAGWLYIRSDGFHGPVAPVSLYSLPSYEKSRQNKQWVNGLSNGCMLGLMVYNLLLWLSTRERMYMSYMLLSIFNLLTIATHQTLLQQWMPLIDNIWHTNFVLILPLFVSMFLSMFFRHILETARYATKSDIILRTYEASIIFVFSAFLVGVPIFLTTSIFLVYSFIAGFLMVRHTLFHPLLQPTVKLLLLCALMMPVLSATITTLSASGSSLITSSYMYLMQSTDVMEMLFLSLAMAFKVNMLQRSHKIQLDKAAEQHVTHTAQNRLLAHLNHEFRTPLNGILAASELLVSRSEKKNLDTANLIYRTAMPLKSLIDELVSITNMSEQRHEALNVRFNLDQLLRECADIFVPAAQKQNVRLYSSVIAGTPYDVKGDPYRIRQILLNLLGNALKFTQDGLIGISARQDPTNPALFLFEVFDDGQPIPDEFKSRLFQRFEQSSAKTNLPSTGLGLSIVQQLSQALGGDCGLRELDKDAPQHGKIFWFRIKLDAYQSTRHSVISILDRRRIILADEHPVFTQTLANTIGTHCSLVNTVHSCRTLETACINTHFDLALIHDTLLDKDFDHSALEDIQDVYVYSAKGTPLANVPTRYTTINRPTSMHDFILLLANNVHKVNESGVTPSNQKTQDLPRILVAEDNPTSQIILSEILKRFPVTVDICSNGREAEQAFNARMMQGQPYQLVFMDCEMPLQDGFETSKNIRELERQQKIPASMIVALTAHNESSYRERSLAAGMDNFLTKPVSIDQIRRCLQRLGAAL